jgi:hypothetical protein
VNDMLDDARETARLPFLIGNAAVFENSRNEHPMDYRASQG